MGGGGGGDNIFGGGNFFNGQNLASTIVNAASNYLTWGLVGFEDGKFGAGLTTRAVDEGIGEVTGRNVARKQMMETQDQIRAERQLREGELRDQQAAAERDDVAASNRARASRGGRGGAGGDSDGAGIGATTQDFLGL